MTSSGDWFSGFKVDLAEQFGTEAVSKMSMYFDLPPGKRGRVEESKNSGLELLSVLEDEAIIGKQDGIDKLCTALQDCSLNRIARDAETRFNELKNNPSSDAPDLGSATNIDISKLKSKLHDQLTTQQCYEIAMICGLKAKSLQEIKDSRDSVNLLIDKLHDSHRIKSSNITTLMFALERLGLIRVANLIKNEDDLHIPGTTAPESETADSQSNCICGENSFEELKSGEDDSRTVSLRCSNCSAEWFQSTMTSENMSESEPADRKLSLTRNNDNFSYKIPYEFNLSKLSNKVVSDVNELCRGDHIIFRRRFGYDHHAILVEVNSGKLKVIQWTGAWRNWKLCASIKVGYVNFEQEVVMKRLYKNSDHADVVIARAFDMMKNSKEKYDIFKNNCENLATYCKVGKSISTQGEVLEDILPPLVVNLARLFGGSLTR